MARCEDTVEIERRFYRCEKIPDHTTYNRHRSIETVLSDEGKTVEVTVEWD